MNYLQITITTTDSIQQEVLIALLAELGYEGFEQQDAAVLAYLPEEQFNAAVLAALPEPYRNLPCSSVRLENRNWNAEWEKSFQPVQVEHFCAVRAHFHAPIPGVTHELLITPKMSFGTGHHATSFMMLQAMQHMDFKDSLVLDFGTGTGLLAILAERLGAARIIAVDNDDWSIENARENSTANGCIRVTLLKTDSIPFPGVEHPLNELTDGPFDLILANINKHVIQRYLPAMEQQLRRGGVILLSGLLVSDLEDIENEAIKNNLSITGTVTKGNWICLKAKKPK